MTGVLSRSVTAAGAVLLALRDIFHTIWHPSGRGGLSRRLMRAVWRAGRSQRRRRGFGPLTGPLAMVVVVLAWVLLILAVRLSLLRRVDTRGLVSGSAAVRPSGDVNPRVDVRKRRWGD